MSDERADFEAWFLDYCGTGPEGAVFDQASLGWLKRREDGHYEETRVRDAWLGWQGRAAKVVIDRIWPLAP